MRLNARGQTSDVFHLLVAAIMGLALLLIVLGIVSVIEQQKFQLSGLRFYDGFGHAINLPNNQVFKEEKLFFKGGDIFTAEALARQFKIKEECVKFEPPSNPQIKVYPTPHRVEMQNQFQTDVYFRCEYPLSPIDPCPPSALYCEIWFGERPPG